MRKLIIISAILLAGLSYAQNFTMTADGYKNEDGKEYYVANFDGRSQEDLFKSAKMYITGKYKNLKFDGYNEVAPDQIILDLNESAGVLKRLGIPIIGGDFTNRYEINFKEGKVMVKPTFYHIELPNGSGGLEEKQVYNKKGKMVINDLHFSGIQEKTNEFVKNLVAGMSNTTDW